MAGRIWETAETKMLIAIWAEDTIQAELEGAKQNKAVYERLAKRMQDSGYDRTWSQCHVNMKNLVSKYCKIRDGNNQTGNKRQEFIHYSALHAVMATKPASRPDTIISSDKSFADLDSSSTSDSPPIKRTDDDDDDTDDDKTDCSEPEVDRGNSTGTSQGNCIAATLFRKHVVLHSCSQT